MTARTVTEYTMARLVDPPTGGDCPAQLYFDPRFPMEVRVTFSDAGYSVVWSWSREVLTTAAAGGAWGAGDVWMWTAGAEVLVRLESPERSLDGRTCCVLALPLPVVRRFLAQTYALVPAEREAERLDLDGELRALLDAGS